MKNYREKVKKEANTKLRHYTIEKNIDYVENVNKTENFSDLLNCMKSNFGNVNNFTV